MLKRLSILCMAVLACGLVAGSAFAQSYCQDYLETGNPGGVTTGLKTCDTVNPATLNPGDTFSIDIWAADLPETIISGGFEMTFNPARLSILSVEVYDGVDIAGPWDGSGSLKIPDPYGPGSYALALVNLSCATPDAGGDVILAKVTFQCLANGSDDISVQGISSEGFDTTVGCLSGLVYDATMGTNALAVTIEAEGCTVNAECDDFMFCNGIETCNTGTGLCEPGTPPSCDDEVSCTTDACTEGAEEYICTHTPVDTGCDDGLSCNGVETCDVALGCQPGTPVFCEDDGVFCNGVEICNDVQDICVSPGNPCSSAAACDEDNDTCMCVLSINPASADVQFQGTVQFTAVASAECAEPSYTWDISANGCTGEPTESAIGGAISANGLYTAGDTEGTDLVRVVDGNNDNICATAEVNVAASTSTTTSIVPTTTTSTPISTTTTTVGPITTTTTSIGPTTTTTSIGPTASIEVMPSSVFQSRWFFLPRWLRIEGTNTNFVRRQTAVTFQPANALLKFPPVVLDSDTILMWVVIMPGWLTGEVDSVVVTAVTGSESASGNLEIKLLPFFLEENQ